MTTLAEVLAAFENRSEAFREIELYEALKALPDGLTASEAEHVRWERMASLFMEKYPDNGSGWGTYYGPMAVFPAEGGGVIETPSLAVVTRETLDYWLQRAREATHPLLRVRYADLAWELAPKVEGARRDIEAARATIDATLELAARPETEAMTGRTKLTRAIRLAKSIRDRERTERVRDAMIEFERRTAKDELAGTWGYCFDELVEGKELLAPGQEARIVSALEDRLSRASGPDGTGGGDPFSVRDIAVRLARYYRRCNKVEEVRRVLNVSAGAFSRLAKQAMPLVGAEWMRDVYDTYREFGLNDEADALNPMLAELGMQAKANLRRVTHEIEIPREHFEELERAVSDATLEGVAANIARLFLVDPEEAEKEVHRLAKEFPIQAIFKQVHLDADGKVESEVGGVQDDVRGRVIVQMTQSMGFSSIYLRHAIEHAKAQLTKDVEVWVPVFMKSPVYREEQRPLLARAISAYMEGDWIAFAHVLIPQVEDAVRTLVRLRGGSHLKPHRLGGMVYRPLDDLLRDPAVVGVFGEKAVQYLQVVLTDQRGLNLRNEVCHGYAPAQAFGPQMADRLLHVALVLAQLRSRSPEEAADEE